MYHSKKIGVFISHIFGEYQQNLCQGIFDTADEYGYLVEVFASTDGENPNTLSGEEGILSIPSCQDFDGIIFATGTYLETKLAVKIQEHISLTASCPVLMINQDMSISNNIVLDNNSPFADLTEHFIMVHHCKRICYLGCANEPDTSKERFLLYKETLAKHNIPCLDENTYTTNFGQKNAAEALEYFRQNGIPDAIICYNDRMALDLMLAAHEAGLVIPNDLAISGCDNLSLSQNITPTLTTITFPTYEVGQEAVHKLIRMTDGILDDKPSVVKGEPLIGCSCGCNYRVSTTPYYAIHQMHEIAKKERRIYQDIHMSSALHEIKDLDDGMDLLRNYISDIPHCSELYICLYENWDSAPRHIQTLATMQQFDFSDEPEIMSGDSNTVFLALGSRNGQEVSPCSFMHRDILPDFMMKKTDSHYICAPLYFEDKPYGYIVLAFDDNKIHYDFHVTSWKNNVARMLKRIADNKHMTLLASRLEDIYIRDELTGLYNNHGLRSMYEMLLTDAVSSGVSVFAVVLCIDNLKDIKQKYGREESDFAIQVVAGALTTSSDDAAVIARTWSDEFCVLIAGFEEDAQDYIMRIRKYLDNYNKLHSKKYDIVISFSYTLH